MFIISRTHTNRDFKISSCDFNRDEFIYTPDDKKLTVIKKRKENNRLYKYLAIPDTYK